MATTKRIAGDYNIFSVDKVGGDNVLITTHTLVVDGNLIITGSTDEHTVSQTTIIDPIITLGKGNPGSIVYLGLEVEKSPGAKAGLRWNSILEQWEISENNLDWLPILTESEAFRLEDDLDPHLGGNLVVNGYSIVSDNGNEIQLVSDSGDIVLSNTLVVPHQDNPPDALEEHTKIYAQAPASGGSGLFVSVHDANSNTIQDELISRSKAIVYSIIF